MSLSLLQLASERGIWVDLETEVPESMFSDEGVEGDAKRQRLMKSIQGAKKSANGNRLHPTYRIIENGRIASSRPNMAIFPGKFLESRSPHLLPNLSPKNGEVIVAAKLCGEAQLAEDLLARPERHFADLLLLDPRFENEDRQELKLAFFRLAFGTLVETGLDRKLREAFPGFPRDATKRSGFTFQLFTTMTAIALSVASVAESTSDCQVVGFLPDSPLVEYVGNEDPELVAARFREIATSLLRAFVPPRLTGKTLEEFETGSASSTSRAEKVTWDPEISGLGV